MSAAVLMFVLSGAVLLTPGSSGAQPEKVYRIGYLQTATREQQTHLIRTFEDRLRDLGYVVGRNLMIEFRFADGKLERLPQLAQDLVRLKVDLIVTGTNPVGLAAKRATTTIPIVMATSVDPVGAGLVASVARPGGNVTGLTQDVGAEIWGKRLELLRQVVPNLSRVAVLVDPGFPPSPAIVNASMWTRSEMVEAGGLMSYGSSLSDEFRRAAEYVDKILKGARPGDLPVEQPTRFELVVHAGTAKALGLAIPPSVLLQADRVVQ